MVHTYMQRLYACKIKWLVILYSICRELPPRSSHTRWKFHLFIYHGEMPFSLKDLSVYFSKFQDRICAQVPLVRPTRPAPTRTVGAHQRYDRIIGIRIIHCRTGRIPTATEKSLSLHACRVPKFIAHTSELQSTWCWANWARKACFVIPSVVQ